MPGGFRSVKYRLIALIACPKRAPMLRRQAENERGVPAYRVLTGPTIIFENTAQTSVKLLI